MPNRLIMANMAYQAERLAREAAQKQKAMSQKAENNEDGIKREGKTFDADKMQGFAKRNENKEYDLLSIMTDEEWQKKNGIDPEKEKALWDFKNFNGGKLYASAGASDIGYTNFEEEEGSSVRKSSGYNLSDVSKAVIVLEHHPEFGHIGTVLEDGQSNTIGYQFGAWPVGQSDGKDAYGPSRVVVETEAYTRYNTYGGQAAILNMTPDEAKRMQDFHEKNLGTLLERDGDLYGNILRKGEVQNKKFSTYALGGKYMGGTNCVEYTVEGMIAGFGLESAKGRILRDGLPTFAKFNPASFAKWLKTDGIRLGIVKDYSEKNRVDYQKWQEFGLP